jgi:hypothetical protein
MTVANSQVNAEAVPGLAMPVVEMMMEAVS